MKKFFKIIFSIGIEVHSDFSILNEYLNKIQSCIWDHTKGLLEDSRPNLIANLLSMKTECYIGVGEIL